MVPVTSTVTAELPERSAAAIQGTITEVVFLSPMGAITAACRFSSAAESDISCRGPSWDR